MCQRTGRDRANQSNRPPIPPFGSSTAYPRKKLVLTRRCGSSITPSSSTPAGRGSGGRGSRKPSSISPASRSWCSRTSRGERRREERLVLPTVLRAGVEDRLAAHQLHRPERVSFPNLRWLGTRTSWKWASVPRTTSGGAPGIRQISPYRCVIARTKSQALPALKKADRAAGSEGPGMPLGAARVVADTGGIVHSARSEAGLGTALRLPAP